MITTVDGTDTFDSWRIKTNQISTDLGDASTLNTVATNGVDAINEVDTKIGDLNDLALSEPDLVSAANAARQYAFAMSIALG
jgi:hypothetical protein